MDRAESKQETGANTRDDAESKTSIFKRLHEKKSSINRKRQILMRSDTKLPQPFASWSNSL